MIHLILSGLILFSTSAFGAEKCSLFELSGSIRENDGDLELIVAQKTMSEKIFQVDLRARAKVAPYRDLYVTGEFITNADKIVVVKKITDSVPDPLNQNESTVKKKLKDVPCPKL